MGLEFRQHYRLIYYGSKLTLKENFHIATRLVYYLFYFYFLCFYYTCSINIDIYVWIENIDLYVRGYSFILDEFMIQDKDFSSCWVYMCCWLLRYYWVMNILGFAERQLNFLTLLGEYLNNWGIFGLNWDFSFCQYIIFKKNKIF